MHKHNHHDDYRLSAAALNPPLVSSLGSSDQEDVGGHSDHHPGHGDHRGLRRVRVLPPQPLHRVGQVGGVGDLPQQAQHRQAAGQPAGDGAVLLHGGWGVVSEKKVQFENRETCGQDSNVFHVTIK